MVKKCKNCKENKAENSFKRLFSGKLSSKCNDCLKNNIPEKVIEEQMYTYMALDIETLLIKIGRSTNIIGRQKQLRFKYPLISMLAYKVGDIELELHKKFKSKRVFSEFFDLSIGDLKNIMKEYGFKVY